MATEQLQDYEDRDFERASSDPRDTMGVLTGLRPHHTSETLKLFKQRDIATPVSENIGEFYNPEFTSTYDQNISYLSDLDNLNDFRASQQSGFLKATNAIVGGLLSGLATAVEDTSYVLDIPSWFQGADEMDNAVAQGMRAAKNELYQAMPIYERESNSTMGEFLKWNSLRSMLDSVVGFALPGGAIGKGLSLGTKALRTARLATYFDKVLGSERAAKAINAATQGIERGAQTFNKSRIDQAIRSAVGGAVMNYGEGKMMAIELGENAEQDYIAFNADKILKDQFNNNPEYADTAVELAKIQLEEDDEFKRKLGIRQEQFVNWNRLNILSDAVSLHGLFRGIGATRNLLSKRLGTEGLLKTIGKEYVFQGAREGTEEILQNALQSEQEYRVKRDFGLLSEDEKKLSDNTFDRFLNFATSRQALVEGLMGFVSGPLQRGATRFAGDILSGDPLGKTRKKSYDDLYTQQQAEIATYKEVAADVIKANALKEEAVANNDTPAFDAVDDALFNKTAERAFSLGTTEQLERQLQDIADLTPEVAEAQGFEASYKEDANARIKELKDLEGTYLDTRGYENANEVFHNILTSKTLTKWSNQISQKINDLASVLNTEIAALNPTNPVVIDLNNLDNIPQEYRSNTYDSLKKYQEERVKVSKALENNNKEYQKIISPEYQQEYKESIEKAQEKEIQKLNDDSIKALIQNNKGILYKSVEDGNGNQIVSSDPEDSIKVIPTKEGYQVMAYNPASGLYDIQALDPNTNEPLKATVPDFLSAGYDILNQINPVPIESPTESQNITIPQEELIAPEKKSNKQSTDDLIQQEAKERGYTPDNTIDNASIDIEIETHPERNKSGEPVPLRRLQDWFYGTRGSSGTEQTLNNDPSQRRWFEFINKTKFGNNSPYQGKILQVSTEQSKAWGTKYNKEGYNNYIVAITDKEGNYITFNGPVKEFNPATCIYTGLTYPGGTYEEYVEYYTDLGGTPESRDEFEATRKNYINNINNAVQTGTPLILTGKSHGITNSAYVSDKQPLAEAIPNLKNKDYEIYVSTTGYVDINGESMTVPKGEVIFYNKKDGNVYRTNPVKIKEADIATISAMFRNYIERSIRDNKFKSNNIDPKTGINFFSYLQSIAYWTNTNKDATGRIINTNPKTAFHFAEGTMPSVIQVGELQVNMVTSIDGQLQPNPEFFSILESFLRNSYYNVKSNRLLHNNEPFFHYTINEKGNYSSDKFTNYKEFLYKNSLEAVIPKGDLTDEYGFIPTRLNQYVRFEFAEPKTDIINTPIQGSTITKGPTVAIKRNAYNNQQIEHINFEWLTKAGTITKLAVGFAQGKAFIFEPTSRLIVDNVPDRLKTLVDNLNAWLATGTLEINNGSSIRTISNDEEFVPVITQAIKEINDIENNVETTVDTVQTPQQIDSIASKLESLTDDPLARFNALMDQIGDVEDTPVNPNELASFKKISPEDLTREKEDFKKAKKWFNEKFPDVPFEVVHGTINGGAYGRFALAAVQISDQAVAGTTYHEAFHTVSQLFLTPEERNNLYKEVSTNKEFKSYVDKVGKLYSDKTGDALYEEVLAEMFMDYMNDTVDPEITRTSIWEKIKRFFSNLLKSLRGVRNALRDPEYNNKIFDLFKQIKENRFTNEDRVLESSEVILNKTIKGKDYKFTNDALEGIHYFFMDYIRQNADDGLISLIQGNNSKVITEAFNYAKQGIKRTRDYFISQGKRLNNLLNSTSDESQKQEINEAFGSLIDKIQGLTDILTNWNPNNEGSGVVDIYRDYIKQFNLEINQTPIDEDSLSKVTDELSRGRDNGNNFTYDIYISNKANASRFTKLLISSLAKVAPDNQGILRPIPNSLGLNTNVNFGQTFNLLANELTNIPADITINELKEKLEFISTKNPSIRQLYKGYINSDGKLVKGWLQLDESNEWTPAIASQFVQFLQSFAKNKSIYEIGIVGPEGAYSSFNANTVGVKNKLLSKWLSNIAENSFRKKGLYNRAADGTITYDAIGFSRKYPAVFKAGDERIREFLDDIGIELSEPTITRIMNQPTRLNHILTGIKKGTIPVLVSNNKETDNTQDINSIIELEVTYGENSFDNSHFNVNGKRVYDNSLYGYVNLIVNQLKGSKQEIYKKLPHLNPDYNYYTTHSKILDMIENGTIENVRMIIVEGNREQESGVAREYSDLKYIDRLCTVYNRLMQGQFNLLRPSDNSLERYIDLGTVFMTKEEVVNSYTSGNNTVLETFRNYLYDELKRSQDPNDNYKFYKKNKSTGLMINTLLKNVPQQSLAVQVNESPDQYATRVINENIDLISYNTNNLIKSQVSTLKTLLIDQKAIVRGKDDTYNSLGLNFDKTTGLTERELDQNLWFLVINDMIGTIEQGKILYGDPAYFKSITDEFKRHSGAIGTKKLMIVTPELNSWIAKNLKRLDKQEGLINEDNGKPIIRTAIFNDVEVTSKYLPEIAEALDGDKEVFKRAKEEFKDDREGFINWLIDHSSEPESGDYVNMTEGDGFGMISLDEYREMKFRTGDWSEKSEMLYQWEIQEAQGIPEDKRTFNGKPLEYGQWGDQVFNSLKPQYYGPMSENGFRPTMYKLSLFPLLPSVVKEFPNLKALSEEMTKQGVGIVTHYSANKGVTTKTTSDGKLNDFYNNKGEFIADKDFLEGNKWLTQDTYYEYWGLQLDTGEHSKHKVVTGTQQMKQVLNGLYNNGSVDSRFHDPDKIKRLSGDYMNLNSERLRVGRDILTRKLGVIYNNGEWTIDDISSLVDSLTNEAIERGLSDNFLAAIGELSKGNATIDSLPNREKIENILMSMASSQTTSRKRNGKASYQVASTMFEKNKIRTTYKDGHLSSSDLAFNINRDGKVTYMEVYMPAYYKNLLADSDSKLLDLIGFRIPTQYTSSIEVIKVKGFLPEQAGDIVVVPSEIVAKAGSDYDIDKLNIYIPNSYNISGKPKYIDYNNWESQYNEYNSERVPAIQTIIENNLGEELNQSTKIVLSKVLAKYKDNFNINDVILDLENQLKQKQSIQDSGQVQAELLNILDAIDQLLDNGQLDNLIVNKDNFYIKAVENRIQEIQRDILTLPENYNHLIAPIKAQTLEEDAQYINKLRSNEGNAYNAPSRLERMLDRTWLTSLNDSFLGGKTSIGISALYNTFHIMAQMYGFKINESIALPHNTDKDGKIELGRLYTADGKQYIPDLLNQWVSAGADIVKKPYMIDLNASPQTLNTFLFLTASGVPSRIVAAFMNQPIIRRYVQLQNIYESQIAESNDIALNSRGIQNLVKEEFKTQETVEPEQSLDLDILSEMISKDSLNEKDKAAQIFILDEFIRYQNIAKKISEAIQATTYDTGDGGKNTSELIYKTLLTDKVIREGYIENFDKLMEEGFISPYYNVVRDLTDIFRPMFMFLQDDNFYGEDGILNKLINLYLSDNTRVSRNEAIRVANKFKLDYLNNIILTTPYTANGLTLAELAPEIMQGDSSVPKIIRELKRIPEFKSNALLNILEPIIDSESSYDYIKPLHGKLETLEINEIVQAWGEFADLPIIGEITIGQRLIELALLQSGLNNSPMSLLEFIPAQEYNKIVRPLMERSLTVPINYQNFYNSFWAANATDKAIGFRRKGVNRLSPVPIRTTYNKKDEYKNVKGKKLNELLAKGIKVFNPYPTILMTDISGKLKMIPGDFTTNNFRLNQARIFYGSDKYNMFIDTINQNDVNPYILDNAPVVEPVESSVSNLREELLDKVPFSHLYDNKESKKSELILVTTVDGIQKTYAKKVDIESAPGTNFYYVTRNNNKEYIIIEGESGAMASKGNTLKDAKELLEYNIRKTSDFNALVESMKIRFNEKAQETLNNLNSAVSNEEMNRIKEEYKHCK